MTLGQATCYDDGMLVRARFPFFVLMLTSCGDDAQPTTTTTEIVLGTTTGSTGTTAVTTGFVVAGSLGAACSTNEECESNLWCNSSWCGSEFGSGYCTPKFCSEDDDCPVVDGLQSSCLDLGCFWPCAASDCPSSLDVEFECENHLYHSYPTCQRRCGS